jgi:hypothetical protein
LEEGIYPVIGIFNVCFLLIFWAGAKEEMELMVELRYINWGD